MDGNPSINYNEKSTDDDEMTTTTSTPTTTRTTMQPILKGIDLSTIGVLDCAHITIKSDINERSRYDVLLINENAKPACAVFYCDQCSNVIAEYMATRSAKLDVLLMRSGEYRLEVAK